MCNAHNHSDECECGFGPPYPHGTKRRLRTRTPRRTWKVETATFSEQSLDDEKFFVGGLRALNFQERTYSSFLKSYRSIMKSPMAKQRMLAKLQDIVGRRQYKVEKSMKFLANIPLFLLSSPPVVGAKVTYDESATTAGKGGWLVKILGIGMGNTTTLSTTDGFGVTSENGEALQVFLPVDLLIQTIGVYKSGKRESVGTRIEIKPWEPGDTIHNTGSRSLSEEEVRAVQLGSCNKADYNQSNNQSVNTTIYRKSLTIEKGEAADLNLPMRIANSQFQLTGQVSRSVTLQLKLELPGGHLYVAHSNAKGLQWEVDPIFKVLPVLVAKAA